MKSMKNILLASLSLTIVCAACKKDEEFIPQKYAEETILYPNEIPAHDGLMLSIRDYIGIDLTNQEIPVDAGVAEYGSPVLVNVGEVKVNNKALTATSSNKYVSNIDVINFDFNEGSQNRWAIAGVEEFPAFNRTLTVKMPGKIAFDDVPEIISLSGDVTLKVEKFPNHAQAIIWNLKDVEGNFIQKETTTNELTLTSAELAKLKPAENCLLKVAAYSMETWESSEKKYLFINQTVETAQIQLK